MVNLVGGYLYHYTTMEGLKGIFSNSDPYIHDDIHIRFSTTSRFSDEKEGTHAIDLFHEVCSDFFADKKSDKELYEATKEIKSLEESFIIRAGDINDAPTDILPRTAPIVIDYGRVETFIACFSESDDNKDLWHFENNRNSDFAIEFFDPNRFQLWLPDGNSNKTPFEVRFEKVIYNAKGKRQKVEDDLCDAYQLHHDDKEKFISSLRVSLSEYQYLFKRYKYHKEVETRAIIRVQNLDELEKLGISVIIDAKGKFFHFPMNGIFVGSIRIRSDVSDTDAATLAGIARECVPNTTVLFKGRPI